MAARRTKSRLHRLREITAILIRHGMGYLVGILGLGRFVPFHKGLLGHARRSAPYTRPEHVRVALEELGATFIKLGQILSTRSDLVPPDLQRELAKLQDAVPPVPAAAIRKAVEVELGHPIETLFAAFDLTPLAAGSIGQAHAATLADGTEVVVKIRRPGVVAQVEEDLAILQSLAVTASQHWELAKQYDVIGLAQEFAGTLRAELDYIREGRSAERFAANFAGDLAVHIPRIIWDRTTSQMITLERIRGIKIDDLAALDAAGIDRAELARRATGMLLKMVFDDGFFHADPHPGNFFVERGGRIGLIDFGMTGALDEQTRERLSDLLLAVTSTDADRLVDAFLELGVAGTGIERSKLREDLAPILAKYANAPLEEIGVGEVISAGLALARRHHLQLPPNVALLFKTLVMSEGLGVQLDPDFQLVAEIRPYAERLLLRRFSPFAILRRLEQFGLDAARLGIELPQQLRRLLGDVENGNLTVQVRPSGFEPLLGRLERLVNRIVLGIIAAAFISGLAVLMSVYHPGNDARWLGAFFGIGLGIAATLGAYLAWSILRSGHK